MNLCKSSHFLYWYKFYLSELGMLLGEIAFISYEKYSF
uniref:Uncharacterized protein n=1 Tax=Rhizophora mucronata TaxID=61149 RepID=A0A2P2NBF6_RHIMU